MLTSNARITLRKGLLEVDVLTPGLVIEVRDYDIEGLTKEADGLWTDEHGKLCARYFATGIQDAASKPEDVADLRRFAEDLAEQTGLPAKLEMDAAREGLHVLTYNNVDFYFCGDGRGYDGWGKMIDPDHGKNGNGGGC